MEGADSLFMWWLAIQHCSLYRSVELVLRARVSEGKA